MADLINRESVHDLIRGLKKYSWTSPVRNEHRVTVDTDDVQFGVDKIPAVDAVPVLRCKDCKHCRTHITRKFKQVISKCCRLGKYDIEFFVRPDDFCSYGERRNDDAVD